MKIKFTIVMVSLLILPSYANAADANTDRNAALINSFQVLCTLESPSFDRIDQKAAAMKIPVHKDVGQSQISGYFAHSKSWLVPLKTGPHELVATEANGPKGHIEACGISAPDPDGGSFIKELIEEMHLGLPASQIVSADGMMRTTTWKNTFGEGTELRLVDATPKERPGAMLFYDVTTPTTP